jgi:hypothetical protein
MRIGQDMALASCFCTVCRVRTGVAPQIRLERSRCRSRLVLIVPRRTCQAHELRRNAVGTKPTIASIPQTVSSTLSHFRIATPWEWTAMETMFSEKKRSLQSVLRCGTGGRPHFDDLGGSGGSNGSICCHSVSDTNSATDTPPCFSRRCISSKFHQILKKRLRCPSDPK